MLLVCAAVSVTVTVKIVDSIDAVGVPVIAPVVLLKVYPAGKLGLIEYVKGVTPPVAVTGVNAIAATFLVNVLLLTACVVVMTG